MKKTILAILLTMSALPAFAQRYPVSCQAGALDRYNRLVARFYGHVDPRSGQCRSALRDCNREIRRRGWYDVRCVQLRGW